MRAEPAPVFVIAILLPSVHIPQGHFTVLLVDWPLGPVLLIMRSAGWPLLVGKEFQISILSLYVSVTTSLLLAKLTLIGQFIWLGLFPGLLVLKSVWPSTMSGGTLSDGSAFQIRILLLNVSASASLTPLVAIPEFLLNDKAPPVSLKPKADRTISALC